MVNLPQPFPVPVVVPRHAWLPLLFYVVHELLGSCASESHRESCFAETPFRQCIADTSGKGSSHSELRIRLLFLCSPGTPCRPRFCGGVVPFVHQRLRLAFIVQPSDPLPFFCRSVETCFFSCTPPTLPGTYTCPRIDIEPASPPFDVADSTLDYLHACPMIPKLSSCERTPRWRSHKNVGLPVRHTSWSNAMFPMTSPHLLSSCRHGGSSS